MSSTDSIKVDIWDAGGMEMTTASLPVNEPVTRLTAILVRKLNMPQVGADGQTISYKLNHQNSGRQLLPDDTLAAAAVADGDVLRLLREIMAG